MIFNKGMKPNVPDRRLKLQVPDDFGERQTPDRWESSATVGFSPNRLHRPSSPFHITREMAPPFSLSPEVPEYDAI